MPRDEYSVSAASHSFPVGWRLITCVFIAVLAPSHESL